jgi:putative transposase
MPYVKNWLHIVWGTKNRKPFLNDTILDKVVSHIRENSEAKNIFILTINGHKEHIHCLLSLSPDQSLSRIVQLLKGESSYWVNHNRITKVKFEWAIDYFGASVSESELGSVQHYIRNQKKHHKQKSWEEELMALVAEINMEYKDPSLGG